MSVNKTNRQSRRLIFISKSLQPPVSFIIHMKESLNSSARIIVPDGTKKKEDSFQRSTRKSKIIATVITVLGFNCNFRLIAIQ